MNIFIYFCIGKQTYINQAIFSIISLLQTQKNFNYKVLVFTDSTKLESLFRNLKSMIEIKLLTEQDKNDWLKPTGDVLRGKLVALKCAADLYPNSNLLFIDTDTVFIESFQETFNWIDSGGMVANDDEGNLSKSRKYGLKQTYQHFISCQIIIDDKKFTIPPDAHMFNTGLIGMQSKEINFIQDVIHFYDQFRLCTSAFLSEQFSLSYFMKKYARMKFCRNEIIHYWYFKEIQVVIDQFISQQDQITLEKIQDLKLPLEKLPSFKHFKSLRYKIPYKIRRKLFQWGFLKQHVKI